MLRDELAFRIKMRNSLRGIEHLDPETIGPRLKQLDTEIAGLEIRIAAEIFAPAFEIVPIGTGVRAA